MEAFEDIAKPNEDLHKQSDLIEEHDMQRVLGVKSVVSMSIAAMVGSVLVLPGPAIGLTGSSAILSVLTSSIVVLTSSLDKSEIATAMPVSGGEYVYLAKAFGPLVGTMAGLALWLTLIFKGSFGLAGFSAYLDAMVGHDTVNPWAVKSMGVGMMLILLVGNLMGLKKLKTYQKWATLFAMLLVTFVCVVSYSKFEPSAFEDHLFENGSTGFIEAIGFVYMGYAGLTKICALASEIKEPEKNMPKAIFISLGFFTPFFGLVLIACLGCLPYKDLTKDYAPLHTLSKEVFGEGFAAFVGIICIFAMAAMANIALMAVSRFPYAMAKDGLLFECLAVVNKENDAPYVSLIASAGCMVFAIMFLPVKQIAKLCSAVQLILFSLVNLSVIVFRVSKENWYQPTFRAPFYPFLQIGGVIAKIVMLVYIGYTGVVAAVVIFTLGFILYRCYGYYHAKFIGIIRVEKWFGLEPQSMEPVKPHDERIHKHPMTEKEFEQEIWEFEEDKGLPHEEHITCEVQLTALSPTSIPLMVDSSNFTRQDSMSSIRSRKSRSQSEKSSPAVSKTDSPLNPHYSKGSHETPPEKTKIDVQKKQSSKKKSGVVLKEE